MATLKELNGWVVEEECILFSCPCQPSETLEQRMNIVSIGLGPDDGNQNDYTECLICGAQYRFVYTIEVTPKEG